MSKVGELDPVVSHAGIPATAEKRQFNWPVVMMGFAVACTLAWSAALLWGLFHMCKVAFS